MQLAWAAVGQACLVAGVAAQTVTLSGSMGVDKALLMIDGQPQMLVVGGSGSDRLQGGAGFDVLVGDGVRLDALIGSYSGTFNRVDDITGATHRATGTLQNNGILGRADLGTAQFDKHFTDLLIELESRK